jgi:hypothetical protein
MVEKRISIYRPHTILRRLLLVDGVARCGKSLLCPILASLKDVEIERMEASYEYIAELYYMRKIEHDAAVTLIQQFSDEFIYNSFLSRNVNFRWQDHSSVFKNPNWMRYVRRLFAKEGPEIVKQINENNPILQTQSHDQMRYVNIYFDAYPSEFQMIEIIRNPIDQIDAWRRRGWGSRFGEDPYDLTLCFKVKDKAVPFCALGWGEEYLEMAPMDRIVRMLYGLQMRNRAGYEKLSDDRKSKVYVIRFEDFVSDPFLHIEKIAAFLTTRTTRYTKSAVKGQKCPRKLSLEERAKKYEQIKKECSSKSLKHVAKMVADYDMEWK